MAKKGKGKSKGKTPLRAVSGSRAKKKPAIKRKPRNQRLPGMGVEDSAIRELENLAHEYADIRDQRMELSKEESTLSGRLLGAMKRHGKTEYKRDGITIRVVVESEKVKVRIKAESDEDQDEDTPAETASAPEVEVANVGQTN